MLTEEWSLERALIVIGEESRAEGRVEGRVEGLDLFAWLCQVFCVNSQSTSFPSSIAVF
jgi:hypothetical protein